LVDTLNKQINEALPSIREATPEVPAQLEEVVKKMCAKDPAKRHANPDAAITALRKAAGLQPETKVRVSPDAPAAPAPAPAPAAPGRARGPAAAAEPADNVWPAVAGILIAGAAAWAALWWVMNA